MKFLDFDKPQTIGQWIIFAAAIGITCTSPYGTRAFLKELKKYIAEKMEARRVEIDSRSLTQALYYLRKRKIIKFQKEDGFTNMTLTEKGKKRKLELDFRNIKIKKPNTWDGKWRIIMFDVPEGMKAWRDALRDKFKKLGLMRFQKSVWIYPYECEDEIDFVAETLGIRDHLHFLTVTIEQDAPMQDFFNL